MIKGQIFPVERLRQLVSYDAATGFLYWKPRFPRDFMCTEVRQCRAAKVWNARYSLRRIDSRMSDGRVIVHFNLGRRFRTQGARVAWAIYYGAWPEKFVDHIDGDCTNDRIENLRQATVSENNRNKKINSKNTSGKVGVTFYKRTGKWRAWIKIDGRTHSLGYFAEKQDAISARIKAENENGFYEATRQSEEKEFAR